jgi:hypothetical protein
MANTSPYGFFGPVCDFTGGRTGSSVPIITVVSPKDVDWVDDPSLGVMVSNPDFLFAPTLTKFQRKGDEVRGVIDYDWENDEDFADVLAKHEKFEDAVRSFRGYVAPRPQWNGVEKFCEESRPVTNIADEIRDNELIQFVLKSKPLSFTVTHDTWNEEMNQYAAWTSLGVCSFEEKTIALGNAVNISSTITVPTSGVHTLRFRFSKQGEVWLNKFSQNPIQILNLTETRDSYNASSFINKQVTLSAGTYTIDIGIENPTVGTYKRDWIDSPAAAALQIYQGTYSVTSSTGIPTTLSISPVGTDSSGNSAAPSVTWRNGEWSGVYAESIRNNVGVHSNTEGGDFATISLNHSKGLVGTIEIMKIVNTTETTPAVTTIGTDWTTKTITAYGSGYEVDETINLSYTGSLGGTVTALLKIDDVTQTSASGGTLIWSTQDNLVGFTTTTTTI